MPRLCDQIYQMVIDADLKESQRIDLFHQLTRYIIHLRNGHDIRKVILKYKLESFYYGENKLQERIELSWTLWRVIWDIIYRDAYTKSDIRKSARYFEADIDDVMFLMNNIYQEDIETVQGLHYDVRNTYQLYDPSELLESVRGFIVGFVKRKMRFLFVHDPGIAIEDFIATAEMKALQGFYRYDGNCISKKDAQQKMLNCAMSWIMDYLNHCEDSKRVVMTPTGYERRMLSLNEKTPDGDNELLDTVSCNESEHELILSRYLEEINRRCSKGVAAYVNDVVFGQGDISPYKEKYYIELRRKHGIKKQQVIDEVNQIILGTPNN